MTKQKLKSVARRLVASGYYASHHFLNRLQGKTVILMYHRVLSGRELQGSFIQPGMYVRDDVFEMHLLFLKKHFEILPFAELLDVWKRGTWDEKKRYCVITFDDGWLDNYLYAYPIMKRHGIAATIFLPTSVIGTDEWFWPDKVSYILSCYYNDSAKQGRPDLWKSLWEKYPWMVDRGGRDHVGTIDSVIETFKGQPPERIADAVEDMKETLDVRFPDERALLNWSEIGEMSEHSITFGSHSCTHSILTGLTGDAVKRELEDSLSILKGRNINFIPVFCYPNGNYTRAIAEQVKQTGYEAAVSTRFGFESNPPHHFFGLRRIGVHNDISSTRSLLAYRLSCVGL